MDLVPGPILPEKFLRYSRESNPVPLGWQSMGGSPGELSEEFVTQEKRNKGWRLNCDVGEATEGLENEFSFTSRTS